MGIFYNGVINEVYFGKTKELLEIEKLIGIIKEKYSDKTYFSRINLMPEMQELNRKFENYFGFKVFSLHVQDTSVYNAMTIPIGCRNDILTKDLLSNYVVNKDGYRFKKEAEFTCMVTIYSGIFLNSNFSPAETLAIILHEIGHNFSSIINNGIGCYQDAITYANFFILIFSNFSTLGDYITNTNYMSKAMNDMVKVLAKKFPAIIVLFDSLSSVGGFIQTIGMNISTFLDIITMGVAGVIGSIQRKLQQLLTLNFTAYTNEKIADNFASIYGYGAELTSALGKMETNKMGIVLSKNIDNIPIVGPLVNITQLPSYIITSAFDEHPIFIERCNDQIRILETELRKGNIDPKMKKEIEKNISEIEKTMDEFTNTKKGIKDPILAKKLFWGKMLKLSDGDFKHFIYGKNNAQDFDTAYELKDIKFK